MAARRWDRDEESPLAKQVSAPLLCLLTPPNCFEFKSRARDISLVSFWGKSPGCEAFFPFVALLCQLLGVISLRAGQAFHSQELSQLFSHSRVSQTDEDFLQCLCYLKFFTKSFYICSACAKILLHVLKIWNASSCNGVSCTLHFHSLIGAVWLNCINLDKGQVKICFLPIIDSVSWKFTTLLEHLCQQIGFQVYCWFSNAPVMRNILNI